MSVAYWEEFLRTWDEERSHILALLPSDRIELAFFKEMRVASAYVEPAPVERIQRAEDRLGHELPLDLKTFYEVSNGWPFIGMSNLAVVGVDQLSTIPSEPRDYIRDIDEHFSIENESFISVRCRPAALLLSNISNFGFCVANPTHTNSWEYACVEFGARSDRYGCFLDFMKSARWYCLHYLRGHLE